MKFSAGGPPPETTAKPSIPPSRAAWLVLAALWGWHALLLGTWLRQDMRPPKWDQSVHLSTAWEYKEALASGSLWDALRVRPRPGHPPYPPLVHYGMVPLLALARTAGFPPEDAATLVNLLFIAFLIVGAFLLAAGWWGEAAGLCAAFLTGLAPPVLLYAREPLVDLALAAWVVLAYACWARSGDFSARNWSLAAGVCAGLGMLSKWSFVFYVFPLLAAGLWSSWKNRGRSLWFFRSAGLALLVCGPWYAVNLLTVVPRVLRSASMGKGEGDPSVASLASWLWYLDLAREQIFWAGLLLGAAGLVWLLWRRRPGAVVLAGWFAAGYVFWSLLSNKNDRYFLPVLLVLPLAAASLPRRIPWAASAAALAFSGWLTWGRGPRAVPPRPDIWPLEDVVRCAATARDPALPFGVLTVAVNHDYMNANNLRWTAEKLGLSPEIIARGKLKRLGELSEFILLKTGNLGPDYASIRQEEARQEALRPGGWFLRTFERLESWPLPDGSEAVLFRQRPDAGLSSPDASLFSGLIRGVEFRALDVRSAPGPAGVPVWEARAEAVSFKGLTARDVRLRWEGMAVARDDQGAPRLLRLRRVSLDRARLSEGDLAGFLSAKARWLKSPEARFLPDGRFEVRGRAGSVPLRLVGELGYHTQASGPPRLSAELKALRVGGVPLPAGWGGFCRWQWDGRPAPGMPFWAALTGLRTAPAANDGEGFLEVSPEHD